MDNDKLTAEEQRILLELARKTISEHLDKGKTLQEQTMAERLRTNRGVFVSLHKQGALRGCIGTFSSSRSLCENVREMALTAALHDPRFPPVQQQELSDIDIEISVLTPLREIKDISSIEVGRHGIFITRGGASGVLLPQVATEYGWDRDAFVCQTCRKAGLAPDAWKQPGTKIEVFEAQVFGEKSSG